MLIRHFTKPHWILPILTSGFINVERSNSEEQCRSAIVAYWGAGAWKARTQEDIEFGQRITQAKGNQVWLTSEKSCNTAVESAFNDCYFEFDSDEIGAKKWHHFKKQFTSSEAKRIISMLDRSAKHSGDDPYQYWVVDSAISIRLAKNLEAIKEQYAEITFA